MNSSRKTCPTPLTVRQRSTAVVSYQRRRSVWSGRWAAPWQPVFLALLVLLLSALPRATAAQAAMITVNVLTDNAGDSCPATCSLRAALATASAGDAIQFSVTGTIVLRQGQLVVDKHVTIMGPGASSLAIDGNHAFKGLLVTAGVTATISGLTIQNGISVYGGFGGGISNGGTLTLINCTLSGNTAFYGGGGISNGGTLTLTNSILSGNSSDVGGGISNGGTLTLTNSILSGNSAGGYGGGGIYNFGTLTLTNSTLSGNSSSSLLRGGFGGGIYNGGTAMLTNSTLSGNSASHGGGIANGNIYTGGDLILTNSTLSDNFAYDGGGIYNTDTGTAMLTNSTLSDNSVSIYVGGGIYNLGTLTLTNCTLSGSSAFSGGGGIYNLGTLTLTNCTLSDNSSGSGRGGGIFIDGGTLTLANSIVANSPGGNCRGPITSLGHNLSDTGDCFSPPAPGDHVSDPRLGAFLDPGIPGTGHFPLLATSPAIDAGDEALCANAVDFPELATDQLNKPRSVDGKIDTMYRPLCDIGAVEFFPIVNMLVQLSHTSTRYDPTPVPGGPAGTFVITAKFKNITDTNPPGSNVRNQPIFFPFFEVVGLELQRPGAPTTDQPVLLNADGGIGRVGARLTPQGSLTTPFPPGATSTFQFRIGLQQKEAFRFFVNLLGEIR